MSSIAPHIYSEEHKALTVSEKERPDTLRVNEIFFSIQGESSRAGEPCTFVRLTGCGLRCSYCDTEYAFYEGRDMPVSEVAAQVERIGNRLVELTGGEPLEQQGAFTLMQELLQLGYEVMVETGGHVDIAAVDPRVRRIVDLKTPSSGMVKRNRYSNMEQITKLDEIKFVIGSREDYEWASAKLAEFGLAEKAGVVLMSPVKETMDPTTLAGWILQDHLPVKLQVQLHKILWPEVIRAV